GKGVLRHDFSLLIDPEAAESAGSGDGSSLCILVVGWQVCVGSRNTQLFRPLVGHGEQATNAARDRVFGHGRVRVMPELVETRVTMAQAELPCIAQVIRHVVAEDLEGSLHPGAGC